MKKGPSDGQKKTILFLLQLGDDGNPKKDADEPVWGYFLQQRQTENIEQVEGFLYCNRGKEKTTPQKKRDILAVLYSDLHE